MNTFGVVLCLLVSMAVGYGLAKAVDGHFYIREWFSEKPWTVKVKPWMVVLGVLLLIVGIGLLMWVFGAPEIVYYIVSGALIGIMLVILPSDSR